MISKKNLSTIMAAVRLIMRLAFRDLKIQYAQSVIGITWALIQPLTGLVIYTFLFDKVLNVSGTSTVPYPVFVFAGIMNWMLFSSIISRAGTVLSSSTNLIKNWSFPRLVLPLSKTIVSLLEFGLSLPILIGLLWYYGIEPKWQVVLVPLFILANILCALSIALWLSALTVRYRDFHHIIPYLVGFGVFVTPVFFSSTLIPKEYSFLMYFNPMSFVIEGFRWCLHDGQFVFINYTPSIIMTSLSFIGGLLFFKKQEGSMVDFL